MTRPLSLSPHMLAHDAMALAHVIKRTSEKPPTPQDLGALTRAMKRAIADEKRTNTKEFISLMNRALSLASTDPFDTEARDRFHRYLRAGITCLVHVQARRKIA